MPAFVSVSRTPHFPNRNPQHECPKKANTFCSKACVHEHRLRTDSSYVRKCLLVREPDVWLCVSLIGTVRNAACIESRRSHDLKPQIPNPKQVRDRGVCAGCGLDAHALYLRCRRACIR